MSDLNFQGKRLVAVAGAVCLCLAMVGGSAVAVDNAAVTTLTNDEVESGQSATHTLEYEADGVSADGTTDVVMVTLPNAYAGNVSFSTVEFVNRTSGATVPISSSTTVVDGPDDDGVMDTIRTGINNDADYATDDITATYEFSLSHPPVESTTSYDVTITVEDSMTERSQVTATDAITVVGTESMSTSTDNGSTTTEADDTATPTEMGSDEMESTATATEMGSDEMESTQNATETTSTTTPGFGVVLALLAVVAATALLTRRE